MRRMLLVLLAAAAFAVPAIVVTAPPAHAVIQEYGCFPSPDSWDVEGRWASGTVMESQSCLRHDTTTDLVQVVTWFRTRRGGTPIQSDWDLNGTNGPQTVTWVMNHGTGHPLGVRSGFGDAFDTSIVAIQSWWECEGSGNQSHEGFVSGVSANPNGTTDGASGYKNADTYRIYNDYISC
jgi:hypothetical protein